MNEQEVRELLRSVNPDDQMTGFTRTPIFLAVILALVLHGAVVGLGFIPWDSISQSIGLNSKPAVTENSTDNTNGGENASPEGDGATDKAGTGTEGDDKDNTSNDGADTEGDKNDPASVKDRVDEAQRKKDQEKEDPDSTPGGENLEGVLGF